MHVLYLAILVSAAFQIRSRLGYGNWIDPSAVAMLVLTVIVLQITTEKRGGFFRLRPPEIYGAAAPGE